MGLEGRRQDGDADTGAKSTATNQETTSASATTANSE